MILNYSTASERNKGPIFEVLEAVLADRRALLELGSGSGQHALHMAPRLEHLLWYPSELPGQLAALTGNLQHAAVSNIQPPRELDVRDSDWDWPSGVDAVFTANTLHIMAHDDALKLVTGCARLLPAGGRLCVYGPFTYNGEYTSGSNAEFDRWLKARDPASGIRAFEVLDGAAQAGGMACLNDFVMPANNQLIVWEKR